MAYVEFSEQGYKYFDNNHYCLFSIFKDEYYSHYSLFGYASTTLKKLPILFQKYISEKIDIITFELKDHSDMSDKIINEISDILISAHPYYKYECDKVIIKTIGDYYNDLLLYALHHCPTLNLELSFNDSWYYDRLMHLMPSALIKNGYFPDGLYPNDFHRIYKDRLDIKECDQRDIEESFVFNAPSKMPQGFSVELKTQKIIRNMLYLLNELSPNMKKLKTSQRIWLYENIVHRIYDWSEICISENLPFCPTTSFLNANDCNIGADNYCRLNNIYGSLCNHHFTTL